MANEPSQDKGVIIVPVSLLEEIDQCRDKLSRAEFVEFCVDALLKQEEEGVPRGAEGGETVSRQEFDEFKKGIKNLQRAYIDLLLTISLEPLSKASAQEIESFKQRLAELLET